MNLEYSRKREIEQERIRDLISLIQDEKGGTIIDIGARDGYLSKLLADYFESVTALDIVKPSIEHEKVICVQGDATDLAFPNNAFDVVFCAEVLEHIPPQLLQKACAELERIAKQFILIGAPYKQDIRVGRTTCYTCMKKNPPFGHVNVFDEKRLTRLFSNSDVKKLTFIGKNMEVTNFISTFLMDLAGNPFGFYHQEEPCVHCGSRLLPPKKRNLLQKVATQLAYRLTQIQKLFVSPRHNWIHMLLMKRQS